MKIACVSLKIIHHNHFHNIITSVLPRTILRHVYKLKIYRLAHNLKVLIVVYCFVLVHRHLTGYASKRTTKQVHPWAERGGGQRHPEVPTLCGPRVCHPQCGDGLIQEEKVRTYTNSVLMLRFNKSLNYF